jgi:hypothetical protein
MTKKLPIPSRPSPLKHCVLQAKPTKSISKAIIQIPQNSAETDILSDKDLREQLYGNFPVMKSNTYQKQVAEYIIQKLRAEQAQKDAERAALSKNDTTSDQELSGEVSLKCEEESLDDWF